MRLWIAACFDAFTAMEIQHYTASESRRPGLDFWIALWSDHKNTVGDTKQTMQEGWVLKISYTYKLRGKRVMRTSSRWEGQFDFWTLERASKLRTHMKGDR